MTELETIASRKRFPFNGDFWFEIVFGTIMYSGVFGLILLIAINKNTATGFIPTIVPFILFIPIFSFWYLKQNVLKAIENNLTKSTNSNKVRERLRQLNWEFSNNHGIFYSGSKPFILKWVFVRIIPMDNEILYSFQYNEGRGFRPLFFIGIRTYLKWKFKKQLSTPNPELH